MSGDQICDAEACNNRMLSGLNKCLEHVYQITLDWHTNEWMGSLPALEAAMQIAVRKQWTYTHNYQAIQDRVQEIRDGKRPSSDLVILDNEFSPSSQQPFEIAIIDRVYGRILINTLVKHPEGSRIASNPYSSASNGLPAAIKNFLATGGYSDILPSNDNCIPLLQVLRHQQLPAPSGFRIFPLKLEIIFSVFYPRHKLCGRNHRTLVDCQQTKLVLDKFDSLCNPVESRGSEWQPEEMATVSQRQILDFFNWEKKTVSNEKQDGIDGGGESGGPSTVTTHAVAKTEDEGNKYAYGDFGRRG
ncbi:uncharacterized protein LW94_7842 [Fusarium fujikuroi]|nr:uncharacterized protein LW94_7842 [Fusarium fujikuroi]